MGSWSVRLWFYVLVQGLQEGVTWIGRGTFEASLRAQLLCSRRQACFTLTGTGLRIECHGINPLLFVVCHSKDVHGTEVSHWCFRGKSMELLKEILHIFCA